MCKHGGTPSWRDKCIMLAANGPPGAARSRSFLLRPQGKTRSASPRPSAPTYPTPCSPVCALAVLCCVCGASLQDAHSSILTAAFCSWQGLGTLWARTGPSGRRLFCGRQELGSLLGAHTSIPTVAGVAWHLFLCRHSLRVLRAVRVFAAPSGRCCSLWRAWWPRVVHRAWSGSVLRSAFLTPWCLFPTRGLPPPDLLGCRPVHVGAGRERGSWCLPLAPAKEAALGSLRIVPVPGPL